MVFFQKLDKPFQIYMYLKCFADGVINKNSEVFNGVKDVLGFRSHNTVNKHLKKLIALNWIGYDPEAKNYFIRSFPRLQSRYDFRKKQSVCFYVNNIRKTRAFLGAVILNVKIQNQKYYFEGGKRRKPVTAANITGAALQVLASPAPAQKWVPRRAINDLAVARAKLQKNDKPSYYGYSNKSIAKILHCSKTTATDLKHDMEKCGFIKTIEHSTVLQVLEKRDYAVRKNFYVAYPELNGKIFFRTALKKLPHSTRSKKIIEVVQQQYDEIIPLVKFTRRSKSTSSLQMQKVA